MLLPILFKWQGYLWSMLFKFSKSTINTRSSSVLLLQTPPCTSAKYYFSGFLEIMGSQTPANIFKPKHKSSLTLLSHLQSEKSPSQVLCRDICLQSPLSALQNKKKKNHLASSQEFFHSLLLDCPNTIKYICPKRC